MTSLGSDHGRSMVGSWSHHGRVMLESSAIVNDASSVFNTFSSYFGTSFLVASAVFGDVGGRRLLLRAM